MNTSLKLTIYISFFILASCSSKPDYTGKAIVLFAGGLDGELFKKEQIVIAYKFKSDSVAYLQHKLHEYNKPVLPGDSIEIEVKDSQTSFGRVFKNQSSTDYRYLYSTNVGPKKKVLLFDNNIVSLVELEKDGSLESIQYFQLNNVQEEYRNYFDFIGYRDSIAFTLDGGIGSDSLYSPNIVEVFYLQE